MKKPSLLMIVCFVLLLGHFYAFIEKPEKKQVIVICRYIYDPNQIKDLNAAMSTYYNMGYRSISSDYNYANRVLIILEK